MVCSIAFSALALLSNGLINVTALYLNLASKSRIIITGNCAAVEL